MRMSQMYNNNCLAVILFFEYVLKIMIRGCITNVLKTLVTQPLIIITAIKSLSKT